MLGWRSANINSISLNAFSSGVFRKILIATDSLRKVPAWTLEKDPEPSSSPRTIFCDGI